jgi:heme-binding NEAT domain protein
MTNAKRGGIGCLGILVLIIVIAAAAGTSSKTKNDPTVAPATRPAPTPAPTSKASTTAKPQTFTGNGTETIGTVVVPAGGAIIKWTNNGAVFQIYDDTDVVEVNSQAHAGQSAINAGAYRGFEVNAIGSWTVDIVPK